MEKRTSIKKERIGVRGENKVFTIDVPGNAKRIIGIQFSTKLTGDNMPVNRHYFGKSVTPFVYSNSFVQGLSNEQMESTVKVFSINALVGQKIYYARPSRLDGLPSFEVNAVSTGFTLIGTPVSVTDAETGYTEDYNLFESNDSGFGQVKLYVF